MDLATQRQVTIMPIHTQQTITGYVSRTLPLAEPVGGGCVPLVLIIITSMSLMSAVVVLVIATLATIAAARCGRR